MNDSGSVLIVAFSSRWSAPGSGQGAGPRAAVGKDGLYVSLRGSFTANLPLALDRLDSRSPCKISYLKFRSVFYV